MPFSFSMLFKLAASSILGFISKISKNRTNGTWPSWYFSNTRTSIITSLRNISAYIKHIKKLDFPILPTTTWYIPTTAIIKYVDRIHKRIILLNWPRFLYSFFLVLYSSLFSTSNLSSSYFSLAKDFVICTPSRLFSTYELSSPSWTALTLKAFLNFML